MAQQRDSVGRASVSGGCLLLLIGIVVIPVLTAGLIVAIAIPPIGISLVVIGVVVRQRRRQALPVALRDVRPFWRQLWFWWVVVLGGGSAAIVLSALLGLGGFAK